MGDEVFSRDSYQKALKDHQVSQTGVTRQAEEQARRTGLLNEIVDPAVNPIRRSLIRLNPHQKKWVVTVGCPMDIEVSCDTTGSMRGEVDIEMRTLPKLYDAVAKVLPGYDPQLCLGIFGDCYDDFTLCRPQFEMRADRIVGYLKEMVPLGQGYGNHGEDPQYAMFARAYLTDAYTNRIGLKGYHFIITDEPFHNSLKEKQIRRIFGDDIFENELKEMNRKVPSVEQMVKDLKEKTHQFVLVLSDYGYPDTLDLWCELCGEKSVIRIDTTRQLPEVISAIIGLTEGTLDIADLKKHLGQHGSPRLITELSNIDIGAQAKLRYEMPHPVPEVGDFFNNKNDAWPIQPSDATDDETAETPDRIDYL